MKKYFSLLLVILISVAFVSCSNSSEGSTDLSIEFPYDKTYSSYDASAVSAYESVCTAIINGEESVRFNTGMVDNVQQLLYTSFPLVSLVDSIALSDDSSGIIITNVNDTETHLELVNGFIEKINEIEEICEKSSSTKGEYAIKVYNYIATNISDSEIAAISCYETIINDEGTSFSYSKLFEYLLSLNDISTYHIIASSSTGVASGVSAAIIDSSIYYFDVYAEHKENGGEGLNYFGLTTSEIENYYSTLMLTNQNESGLAATDTTFSSLRNCLEWEVNDGTLSITTSSDQVVDIEL